MSARGRSEVRCPHEKRRFVAWLNYFLSIKEKSVRGQELQLFDPPKLDSASCAR